MLILYIWIIILSVLWNLTDGIDELDDEFNYLGYPEEENNIPEEDYLNFNQENYSNPDYSQN